MVPFSVPRSALLALCLSSAGFAAGAVGAGPGQAVQGPPALAAQETNFTGVVAEVTECRVREGVLTVKVRLRNTTDKEVQVSLINNRNFDDYYVSAGGKKYFVLRDTERTALASGADGFGSLRVDVPKGGSYTWWAKYPAPPADQKTIDYVTPFAAPFEAVPVTVTQ